MKNRGFTLIELLVVIGIIVIILGVTMPAISSLSKGNNVAIAGNMVTAQIASARTSAMSLKRHAGVVFFDETGPNATSGYTKAGFSNSQTAMQIIIEDGDQTATHYPGILSVKTVFVAYRQREYLPQSVRVSTLSAIASGGMNVVENTTGQKARAIIFSPEGQMIVRSGLACAPQTPNTSPAPQYDWWFTLPTGQLPPVNSYQPGATPPSTTLGPMGDAFSSPAILIFDGRAFAEQSFPGGDADRQAWLQKYGDVIVINNITGNRLR